MTVLRVPHLRRLQCIIKYMERQIVNIPVGGMTCGNCARSVERKLSASPGVWSAHVDLAAGMATVEFDAGRSSLADMRRAIEQLGYTVRQ